MIEQIRTFEGSEISNREMFKIYKGDPSEIGRYHMNVHFFVTERIYSLQLLKMRLKMYEEMEYKQEVC